VRSLLALVGATTGARRQVHQPEPYKSSRSSLLNQSAMFCQTKLQILT
jgi:hypothetical protein